MRMKRLAELNADIYNYRAKYLDYILIIARKLFPIPLRITLKIASSIRGQSYT
jgi:hypothetical protein